MLRSGTQASLYQTGSIASIRATSIASPRFSAPPSAALKSIAISPLPWSNAYLNPSIPSDQPAASDEVLKEWLAEMSAADVAVMKFSSSRLAKVIKGELNASELKRVAKI